jgi:hypothetical protein
MNLSKAFQRGQTHLTTICVSKTTQMSGTFCIGGGVHLKIFDQVKSDPYLSDITILHMNHKLHCIDFLKI